MSSEDSQQDLHFQQVRALYFRMLDIDESLQDSFLQNAAGFPAEVRQEVAELLDFTLSSDATEAAAMQSEAARVLLNATAIDEYRILGVLGRGGMGIVYHAEAPDGTEVAVKVLSQHFEPSFASKTMAQESSALASLDHPGISKFIASGMTRIDHVDVPFIVTRYIPGESLRSVIDRNDMSRQGKIQLLIGIGKALAEAHKHGISHCDLKPENILLDARGMPCIIDFGLARLRDSAVVALHSINHDDHLVGTLQYMSPEQLSSEGKRSNTGSDIYALGVIAFELLTGHLPYQTDGLSVPEAIAQVTTAQHSFTMSDQLSQGERIVLDHILEKSPRHRYQTCQNFVTDLGRLLRGDSSLAFFKHRFGRALRGNRAALPIATIVLVIAGLLVVSTMNNRQGHVAARTLCYEITVLDDRRHGENLTAAEIRALIPAYEQLLIRSFELTNEPLADQLARYIYFRSGELHYFLAQLVSSRQEFERAAQNWTHSAEYTLADLQYLVPMKSLKTRMNGVHAQTPRETLGLAYAALADYDTPLEFTKKAMLQRSLAWTIFHQQSSDTQELHRAAIGHLYNNLGFSYVTQGHLMARIAFVDSGITLLNNEYVQNNLDANWTVRSYAIHHLAKAHLIRAELSGSLDDLNKAFAYGYEALDRRGQATQGQERASTLALLAESEALGIRLGAPNVVVRKVSTEELIAAADTMLSHGDVRGAAHIKLSAARLLLAEGRHDKDSEKLAAAAQLSEKCQLAAEGIQLNHTAAQALAMRAEVAAAQFELTGDLQRRTEVRRWSLAAAALIPRGQSAPLHASVARAQRILN